MNRWMWVFLALFLTGCGVTPATQSPVERREAALYLAEYSERQRDTLTPITGSYSGERFASEFTGFMQRSKLVFVEEYLVWPSARGRIQYYFRDQALYLVKLEVEAATLEGAELLVTSFTVDQDQVLEPVDVALQQLQLGEAELLAHAKILKGAVLGFDPARAQP